MPSFSLRPFLKILMTAAIVVSSTLLASGQEPQLKKKQAIITQDAMAKYHILDKHDKQGLFQIWNIEVPKVRVQGAYIDNKRSGNWVFFDYEGRIIIRHNYTLNKLITYDVENLKTLQINILDGSDTLNNPDIRLPLVLSPYEIYHNILIDKIRKKFSASHHNRKIIDMTVTALVDTSGQASYNFAYTHNGYAYKVPFKLDNELFRLDWLPAMFKNKTYNSEVSFTVKYFAGPSATYSKSPKRLK